jgi:hypothetical protein
MASSYAQHELQFLPRWTRDAIRDLGDYIDILAKHLVFHDMGENNGTDGKETKL